MLALAWKLIGLVTSFGPLATIRARVVQKLQSHLALAVGGAVVVLIALVGLNMIRASGGNALKAVVAQASTKAATDHLEHTREINRASAMERARLAQTVQDQAAKIVALEKALATPPPAPTDAPVSPSPAPPADMDPIVFPRAIVRELRK